VSPIDQVLATLPVLAKGEVAAAALERLGIRLHEKAAEPATEISISPQDTSWEGLSLQDVTYEYGAAAAGPVAIGPVTFTVRPGQITFIVGGNGSGKTTISKVLTGLYEAHAGSIRLAGRDLEAGNLDWYRSHFAAVFVDFTVFPRPKGVKRSAVAQQKARYYLRALQLTNNMTLAGVGLADLPLSQAQRRRLALFTALLDDRPIYVFDEWAADQDPKFKDLFYRHFLPALKTSGKAVVAVTHDDKYFDCADQVVEMHEGRQVGGGARPRVKLVHSIIPPAV
jgi:putative ATP-binding cassette transporter